VSPRTACILHSDEGEGGKLRLVRRMESCSRELGEKIGLGYLDPQRFVLKGDETGAVRYVRMGLAETVRFETGEGTEERETPWGGLLPPQGVFSSVMRGVLPPG